MAKEKITDKFMMFFQNDCPFSMHYPCKFTFAGKQFEDVIVALEYAKALVFDDSENAQYILDYPIPKRVEQVGKDILNFDESVWEDAREEIMYSIQQSKFSDIELKHYLKSTSGKRIVYTELSDQIWGIGLSIDDEKSNDPEQWNGLNLLGDILVNIRQST